MPDLILIPTELERRFLQRWVDGFDRRGDCAEVSNSPVAVELCGFGLVAAAARTTQLIAMRRPQRVILIGIAGALDQSLRVGSAVAFGSVVVDGIGVGFGDSFQSAAAMGWSQWHDPASASATPIGDRLDLSRGDGPALLSVCAASANARHAAVRRRAHPAAVAEDMEGFGVALACQLMRVPLWIVRGISNVAGNRDFKTWQVESALCQAARLVDAILSENHQEKGQTR